MTDSNTKPKFFLVKRDIGDDRRSSGSSRVAYVKVQNPNPGETIYHGDFVRRQYEIDNGPNGVSAIEYYLPVDETKVTSETYAGDGSDVETF